MTLDFSIPATKWTREIRIFWIMGGPAIWFYDRLEDGDEGSGYPSAAIGIKIGWAGYAFRPYGWVVDETGDA